MFIGIFLDGFVADLNCILYSIAESKMPRDVKYYWAKIENRRREILFSKVFDSSRFFDLTGY
jgi:hypothetical protein